MADGEQIPKAASGTDAGSAAARPGIHVCLLTLYLHESLGVRQLCSVLEQRGHRCSIIFFKEFRWGEFSHVKPEEEQILLDLLRDLGPQLVGLNLTSSFVADLAYDLAEKIRAAIGVPVILGGAHVSACPEEGLEHADLVCLGEGEEALVDVANAIASGGALDSIPNIWTKANGQVRRNDVRPLEQDLDRYPPVAYGPERSYFIEEGGLQQVDPATRLFMYHTTASRMACPFNCTFCGSVWLRRGLYAGKGPVRRYRSVGAIMEEIKQALPRGPQVRLIQFWDEVFAVGAPKGWLDEFCERYPKEIGLPFGIWLHGAVVTEQVVSKLKAAGLTSVVIGIESGSPQVRREVLGRRETNEQILQAAEILHRHGIQTGYDFILDIPWLAEENCRGTFELVMRLPRPFSIGLHSLSFLPKTEIADRALAEGVIAPEQIGRADRALADRFELHYWKYRLEAGDRRAAFWHSMIYLAGMPFIPHALLRRLLRLRPLLQLYPKPLIVLTEIARVKQATGETKLFAGLEAAYPRLAGFLARHPLLGRATNRAVRTFARVARRAVR
jgi:anaerobic magnesium-protoporphyrin IX monomethyl ester cyclase